MRRRTLRCAPLCLCVLAAFSPEVVAQSSDAAELKAQLEQVRAQMQAQQQVMQKMQSRLEELEAKEKAQEAHTAQAKAAAPELVSPATAPAPTTPSGPPPYRPPSALAGTYQPLPEGYIRLGDTGNLLKIDLIAQLDAMFDSTYMGAPDLFVPSSIPVRGQPFYDTGRRSNMSAKQSTFRMDFQRDTDYGTLKVVYKNNFFGNGTGDMPYNLQAFYGELDNEHYSLLAGFNISAFTDIDVFPNTLDYEGPNSFTFKYGPQIRFSPVLYKGAGGTLTLPMSLEQPDADITVPQGFTTYSRRPDITAGLRWQAENWHVQWANILRDLRVENSNGNQRSTTGYATQLTGTTGLFQYDSVQGWASYGKGYANFLQDISGLGLDAAFNTSGDLRAIRARGYGVGYTHGWREDLTSSLAYGYLRISPQSNLLISPDQPKSTKYGSINLAWKFSERAMVGVEYLWGQNIALTDLRGQGQRLQTTFRYDLNP